MTLAFFSFLFFLRLFHSFLSSLFFLSSSYPSPSCPQLKPFCIANFSSRVWKLCGTCNANAVATDAGPGASNAPLISANASVAQAAGHVMTANIIARTAPTLAIAPVRRLLMDHGLSDERLLARARGCLNCATSDSRGCVTVSPEDGVSSKKQKALPW